MTRKSANTRMGPGVAKLILCLVTLSAFVPVLRNDFVNFDDGRYVIDNPMVLGGVSWEGIKWAFSSFHTGNWHPLTWVSHQMDVQIFGLGAAGHHVMSLFFHLGAVILLFASLEALTGRRGLSVVAAALFAVHPLRVESVAWVAERKDVLSALFWFLTIFLYASYARRPSARRLSAVVAAFCAGLLAKPMAVTLPFVLLLLNYWPLGRLGSSSRTSFRPASLPLLEKVPLFLLSALSSSVTFLAQRSGETVQTLTELSLDERLMNALKAPWTYIGKVFVPVHLAPFYPLAVDELNLSGAIISAALLAGVCALCLLQSRRRPYLATGWFWFLGTLIPVIGLVQVGAQALADRYTYVPTAGLLIAICWLWSDLILRKRRSLAPALSAALVMILMVLCALQAQRWRNSISLFTHAADVVPGNYLAHNNLGLALGRAGQTSAAAAQFREAIRIAPRFALPHLNLGNVLLSEGNIDAAMQHYREAARLDPGLANPWYGLGLAYERKGEVLRAADAYRKALDLSPEYSAAANNLGRLTAIQQLWDDAIPLYRKALENDPYNAAAHFNLAAALERQNMVREALEHYRRAAELDLRDRDAPAAILRLGG